MRGCPPTSFEIGYRPSANEHLPAEKAAQREFVLFLLFLPRFAFDFGRMVALEQGVEGLQLALLFVRVNLPGSDPLLRQHAYASARLPLARVDECPEDLLNRILWHAMKGSAKPYPEWAVARVEDDD